MPSTIDREISRARAQLERLQAERSKHRVASVAFIRKAMGALGVGLGDLGGAPARARPAQRGATKRSRRRDGRSVVKPKYRGPKGELWSGRGRSPRWLAALESGGRKRSEFLIG